MLIGLGSTDCFGCSGFGADPTAAAVPDFNLPVDPTAVLQQIPGAPQLSLPAAQADLDAIREQAKKEALYYSLGALGIALLADWLFFRKK